MGPDGPGPQCPHTPHQPVSRYLTSRSSYPRTAPTSNGEPDVQSSHQSAPESSIAQRQDLPDLSGQLGAALGDWGI